jgi:hypothetical protein
MVLGLLVILLLLQMALGVFFTIWLWILRFWKPVDRTRDKRERLLWIAVIAFTLAVTTDFWDLLAPGKWVPAGSTLPWLTFSLAFIGAVFALCGKGRGRIVTTVACFGLAISSLILP